MKIGCYQIWKMSRHNSPSPIPCWISSLAMLETCNLAAVSVIDGWSPNYPQSGCKNSDMGLSENSVPMCTQWFVWTCSLLAFFNWGYTDIPYVHTHMTTLVHYFSTPLCMWPGFEDDLAYFANGKSTTNSFWGGSSLSKSKMMYPLVD